MPCLLSPPENLRSPLELGGRAGAPERRGGGRLAGWVALVLQSVVKGLRIASAL